MKTCVRIVAGITLAGLVLAVTAEAKPPRLAPKRLSSVGDSITEAINAQEYVSLTTPITPNHWASWANGYYGFWEWLLGRTDVNSHNQRISRNFGSSGRANYMEALSGADSYDIPPQMGQSVAHQANYVTLFMGHNDVCQNSFAAIPTDAQFEANVRAGLNQLRSSLAAGSTIYVLAIVDIYKLWDLGEDLTSLGIIDCRLIWATTLLGIFPCGTMLNPLNSEADRQYTRGRNIAFNSILQRLVAEYNANDPNHYYEYTDQSFAYQFTPSQVSGFDCFHPSAAGQKELSRVSWQVGPFRQYTK
jgi:lysophospholipase L1-like esterase